MNARARARERWGMRPADAIDVDYAALAKRGLRVVRVCGIMLNPSTADARDDDPTVRRWDGFMRDWYQLGGMPAERDSLPRQPDEYRFLLRRVWSGLLQYTELRIVNLYPWRTPSPSKLWEALDRGDDMQETLNDAYILTAAADADLVIAAWGAKPRARARAEHVRDLLAAEKIRLHCLRRTSGGAPEHPLYLPKTCVPMRWEP